MKQIAQDIAKVLLDVKAVKVSVEPPFTWTSGIKSPIYCDNRVLIGYPEERKLITQAFKRLIQERNLQVDVIAGTATAAIPWASFLAYEMDLPMVYVRPEPKAHGAGKQIEGFLPEGKKVLLVEDLVSTGGSSLKAVQALRNEGKAEIAHVFSIMTYQMHKAEQMFLNANVELTSLTNFSVLVEIAKSLGQIQDTSQVLEFYKDPEHWAEKFLM